MRRKGRKRAARAVQKFNRSKVQGFRIRNISRKGAKLLSLRLPSSRATRGRTRRRFEQSVSG